MKIISFIVLATCGISTLAQERISVPKPHEFPVDDRVLSVGISADGQTFAAAVKDNQIKVFEANTEKTVRVLQSEGDSERLVFSTDGQILFNQSGTGLLNARHRYEAWRVKDGQLLFSNQLKSGADFAAGRFMRLYDADLSPDGKRLVLCGGEPGGLYTYDLKTAQISEIKPTGKLAGVIHVRFLADSKRLQCLTIGTPGHRDSMIGILGVDGQIETTYTMGKEFYVEGSASSLVAFTVQKGENGATFTDWESGKTLLTLKPEDAAALTSTELFCEGKRLAVTTDRTLRVIDLATGHSMELEKREQPTDFKVATARFHLIESIGDKSVGIWNFGKSDAKK